MKNFLFLLIIVAFAMSCNDVAKVAYEPPTSIDSSYSESPAQAIVVPGLSFEYWNSGDSITKYGAAWISQNKSNLKSSVITDTAVLEWINANVVAGGGSDSLQLTNIGDSINILGGTPVLMPNRVYSVDSTPEIYTKSFPVNNLVINRNSGALYKVQSSAVSGYTTDSIFVIPTGSNFAVLQPVGSSVRFSDVNQAGNDDTEIFTKMTQFAAQQSNITQVLVDQTMYLTDSVRLPSGVSLVGNNNNERVRTLTKYQRIIVDLNDAGKTAITLEDHQFGGGDQYAPGGMIANLNFEVISNCNAVIDLIRPGWMIIEKVMIHSGPVPGNYFTKYAQYGIKSGQSLKLSVSDVEILGAQKYGWYSYKGSAGSTTSYWRNVRIAYCNNAALLEAIDLNVDNLIIESIDSVGIVLAKGTELNVSGIHTENIPSALGPSPIIDIQNGSANIQWGQIASAPGHGTESVMVDTSKYVRLKDLGFANAYQSITTTDQSGYVVFDNVGERGRKVFSDKYGITKPEKLTVIGGYTNFTYENPTSIFPDIDIANEDVTVSDIDSLQVFADMTMYSDTIRMIGAYNLFKRSEELDNITTWQLPGTDIWTVTANDTVAPDGTTTADLITYNLPGSYAQNSEVVGSLVVGETYTFSFYARKSVGSPQLRVFILQTGTDPEATVDIVGDWARYSVTLTPTATISAIGFSLPAGAGNNFHLWGMQVVKGTVPGVYIRTDATSNKPSGTVKLKGKTKFMNEVSFATMSQPTNPDTGTMYVSTAGNLTFWNGGSWVELGGGISDYQVVADSVGNYLKTVVTKTLKSSATTQLGGFNWYIDDAAGGNVIVGSTAATGLGKFEVIGGKAYASDGMIIPNNAGYQTRSAGGVTKTLISMSASDNIVIGDGLGNLNDVYITTGSASDDDIFFRSGGTVERMKITGAGLVQVGANGVFQLAPTTQPSGPTNGMLYTNSTDQNLYFYDGAIWVDLTRGIYDVNVVGDTVNFVSQDSTYKLFSLSGLERFASGDSLRIVGGTQAVATDDIGTKEMFQSIFASGSAVTTGDGTSGIAVPFSFNGMNLINAVAVVYDKGITGTTDIQIRRRRAGANVDMLSSPITMGDEFFAQDGTINLSNDDVQTGDLLFIDVDAIHSGTAPNGLSITLEFRKP